MSEQKVVKTIELTGEKPHLVIQEDSYKGKPMLNIVFLGSSYPMALKFGVGKAKMALWAIEEIKAFYQKHEGKLAASKE